MPLGQSLFKTNYLLMVISGSPNYLRKKHPSRTPFIYSPTSKNPTKHFSQAGPAFDHPTESNGVGGHP